MIKVNSNYEVSNFLSYIEETSLILLIADPLFFFNQEDGDSFSKTFDDKKREMNLFKKVFDLSIIENKKIIKVDDENRQFRDKKDILNEVLELIS